MIDLDLHQHKSNNKSQKGFATTLVATFSTVFIAELGDKTQIATLLLSAESGKPVYVFLAASIALVMTSLLGVLLGRFISKNVPQNIFDLSAGGLMLIIGFWLLIESLNFYIT